MNLVIRAMTLNDQPLSQAIVGCFDAKGGTIGRSDANTMTLPDPERHISRLQAEVLAQEDGFHVRNAASANAIFLNGRALGPGERTRLASHDELRIGGYVLGVLIEADNEAVRTITQGRAAVDARAVIVDSAAEHRTDPRQMAQGREARNAPPPRPPVASVPAMPSAPAIDPFPLQSSAPASAPIAAVGSSSPFADLLGPGDSLASASDPFAGLLGSPAPAGFAADPFGRLNTPVATPAVAPDPGTGADAAPSGAPVRLPDDFDPFADLAAAPAKAPIPAPRVGANDLLGSVGAGSGTPMSIDASFGLGPASRGAADPLAGFLGSPSGGAGAQRSGPGPASTDPFAMFGSVPGSPTDAAPTAHAAFDHTPELRAAYRPPQVASPRAAPAPAPVVSPEPIPSQPPPAAPAPSVDDLFAGLGLGSSHASTDPLADFLGAPASAPVAARPGVTAPAAAAPGHPKNDAITSPPGVGNEPQHRDALWAAFCEGAGIRIELPQGLTAEQMRVLGTVLREAAEGTLRLMAVRATAKNELRAAVTTIRTRNNNPLKFSPNAQAALEQLLQPPLRGFMAGPAAMQDAMHDLLGHSIGTMAGMRAALAGVLGRFEPATLERKLVGSSLMDSLLPMNRKARLWDLYLQHFASIRDDAQDDFHTLFGAAFVAAYEDQLDRLQPPAGDAGA